MGFKVLKRFVDLDGRVYRANERYSKKINEDREITLTTTANKYKTPFIERLGGSTPPLPTLDENRESKLSKEELSNLTVSKLKEIADSLKIKYSSKIRKEELINLLATGEGDGK